LRHPVVFEAVKCDALSFCSPLRQFPWGDQPTAGTYKCTLFYFLFQLWQRQKGATALLLGVLTSVVILVKIDQEMRPWSAHKRIHTLTDWQMQTGLISERELTFAICRRPSVCRLSVVCNVRAPYSSDSDFRQCFYAIWYVGHPLTSR